MVVWEQYVDYKKLTFHEAVNVNRRKMRDGARYADCVCAFDIETTRLEEIEQSIMYVWQFCIDFSDGTDLVILGRTWGAFRRLLGNLQRRLHGLHMRIWVHNLSYEFQFLSGIYPFKDEEVFVMESRSILSASMYKNFEFSCSYKLFNMSLDLATSKYAPDYHKKDGRGFEYDKRRFSDTPLTRKELLYCTYDVWGLCKAVRGIMALFKDDLYTIPHTATGYVRREVKREMRPYHHVLKQSFPSDEVYQLLRAAFRGGNTHASRFYAGEILESVKSVDISSSYPTQQCTKLFPVTPFKRCYDGRLSYLHLCMDRGRAFLIRCRLTRVKLSDPFIHIPYLADSKCEVSRGARLDNGRILLASELVLTITDIDFRIIERQYDFDFEMLDMFVSWYGALPAPLIDINRRYFKAKTELKGTGQELLYMKSKNLLNSIYGMSVQAPVKLTILYNNGAYTPDLRELPQDLLARASKHPYTLYQYGVWTTAHARADLQKGIELCGDGIVYVDTDSCKYVGSADFDTYNERARVVAIEHACAAVDAKGKTHYMGMYEDEGEYRRFKTLGAKKYAYEDKNGKLHITIAGVPKKTGADELERKGGLEAFTPGFEFTETGKLEAVYNDGCINGVKVDGRTLDITKNVVLRPTTYKLDITDEYAVVLEDSSKIIKRVQNDCIKRHLQSKEKSL